MPASPSARRRSTVVGRLRAAGCVFAEEEAAVLATAAQSPAHLDALIDLRVTGRPLEQVVGWAAFCGLRVTVEPDVFVPRRRTQFLARLASRSVSPGAVVVDLCCGSGAVAAAIVDAVDVRLHAVDIDAPAVRCARRNLGRTATVHQGDLYAPLPSGLRGRVDVIVANAPYVPTAELGLLPAEARLYEPSAALDGGVDGLDVQRRVIAEASRWLAPDGRLLVETSRRQEPRTAGLFVRHGLAPRTVRSEEHDATVVMGGAST